jgi:hypothetical protein
MRKGRIFITRKRLKKFFFYAITGVDRPLGFQPYPSATLTPQEIPLAPFSFTGWVDPWSTVRSAGLSQWKFSVNPSGIEPATFQLVMQCLCHLVPLFRNSYGDKIQDYETGHISYVEYVNNMRSIECSEGRWNYIKGRYKGRLDSSGSD